MRVGKLDAPAVRKFYITCFVRAASVWLVLWARMDSSLSLSTPDAFPIFPYDAPYDIQLNLMRHLYKAIEDKAVAVVESPTGTVNCQSAFQRPRSDNVPPGQDCEFVKCYNLLVTR